LCQVQCRIFSHTFNPQGLRLGNKVLRQRLKGPAMAAYYPRKMATFQDLQKAYPDWETFDEEQEDRIEKLKLCVHLIMAVLYIC
jgi:small subunit ribosomal protein S33